MSDFLSINSTFTSSLLVVSIFNFIHFHYDDSYHHSVIAPRRKTFGGSKVASTTVDSTPPSHSPSITKSTSLIKSGLSSLYDFGVGCPWKLADVPIIGTPTPSISDLTS